MRSDKSTNTVERVKALTAQVEAGVKSVYESDNYRKYLMAMSKFHMYSARNTLLILLQCPDATHVAGYNAWRDKFNRHVRRGEKGIGILGYTPRTVETIREKRDGNGKIVVAPDGKPEVEKAQIKVPAYTPVYVFDISQTEGDPLPQLVNELEGTVNGYRNLMAAMRRVSPYPIHFEEINGATRGLCDHASSRIVIQQGMSEVQTVKTAIHEIAHALLHGPDSDLDRAAKEVEAESTAFIVCDHYGLDTSDYSFPYLASWSSGKELAELTASLDTIQRKAFELIEGIDAQLRGLSKVREEPTKDGEVSIDSASLRQEDAPREAAYKLGADGYLYLQTTDSGYDYTLYGPDFTPKDGGQLDNAALTFIEARDHLLQ